MEGRRYPGAGPEFESTTNEQQQWREELGTGPWAASEKPQPTPAREQPEHQVVSQPVAEKPQPTPADEPKAAEAADEALTDPAAPIDQVQEMMNRFFESNNADA